LEANAVHFAGDLAGSVAVLGGLLAVRAGWQEADSAAALFVAVLVLAAAARLIRRNIDVLMDRVPSEAQEIASRAIASVEPPVQLRRLRMRQAGSKQFADVVIGVPPGAAVGQGHAAADAVESALHEALPESDVVVHVEPQDDEPALRERALAAAQSVPQVREIHNLTVLRTDGGAEVSLHLKLPADLPLEDAHGVASEVEQAISESVPEVVSVQTHLEPLAEPARGTTVDRDTRFVEEIVREATGATPRELRFLETDEGLIAFVTLGLDPGTTLADAHRRASEVEEKIRQERPEIADVIVHTEP
jgi:divalent metal cation (Fe/Co/Zn/Cd) transporter